MSTTALDTVLRRLPGKEILQPIDVALALGFSSASTIRKAISEGKLAAFARCDGKRKRYGIAHPDAIDYITRMVCKDL